MRFVVLCIARAWPATHTASSGTTLGNSYSRGVTEQYADVGERIRRTQSCSSSTQHLNESDTAGTSHPAVGL